MNENTSNVCGRLGARCNTSVADPWREKTTRCRGNFSTTIAMLVLAVSVLRPAPAAARAAEIHVSDLLDLDLEELAQVSIYSSASLTQVTPRDIPASQTLITREMIERSGARSLAELLERYVPNLQVLRQAPNGPKIGVRGINGPNDDKLILLVNGRVMNDKTDFGILSERYLSMLRDIEHIEVIRGPGSAIYGPGAIGAVVNIVSHTWKSAEGARLSLRQGLVEEFSSAELSIGHRFSEDAGLFFFYGIDDYKGARPEDSPLHYSHQLDNVPFDTREPITGGIVRDHASYRDRPRHKLHLQFDSEDLSLWARYLEGGQQFVGPQQTVESAGGFDGLDFAIGYTHLTLFASKTFQLQDALRVTWELAYDEQSRISLRPFQQGVPWREEAFINYREDEIFTRVLANWEPTEGQDLAFGASYSHDSFLNSVRGDFPDQAPSFRERVTERWSTDSFALLLEYQWLYNDNWTLFLGGRADHHSIAQWMFSPRAALIHRPNPAHTLKLVYNRSVRRSDDVELIAAHRAGGDREIEEIDELELIWAYAPRPDLSLALTPFYYRYNLINFSFSEDRALPTGKQEAYGLELEGNWVGDDWQLAFSHAYTKLLDFRLADEDLRDQVNTSAPYGFGDDLHNWSNHLTKLNLRYSPDGNWDFDASAVIYWGFPGAEDYAAYNNEVLQRNSLTLSDGSTDAFDRSIFVNAGIDYRFNNHAKARIDFHNVLGWIDKDLNKRNYFARMGSYRDEAAAVSFRLDLTF